MPVCQLTPAVHSSPSLHPVLSPPATDPSRTRTAGQSVPHVHVHVIPRFASDFTPLDDIYPALAQTNLTADLASVDGAGLSVPPKVAEAIAPAGLVPKPGRGAIGGPDVEERRPRSKGEMEGEARELAGLMPEGCRGVFE